MMWFDWIGLIGVFFYLLAYSLLQWRLVDLSDYSYSGFNLIGAVLLLISLCYAFNLASLLAQVLWIAISLVGMRKTRKERLLALPGREGV
ncbi:CBU_0592 family membrane protein [Chromobacterium haemolyticum]|uniref:CBU_0592 family membrane protein n=1 Tax=Chromobacterium haemolyticum TaxID=394935 RepID=UPI0009D96DB0|nr:hypothetical protein [Chromobacterium haemolyticum]OQS39708.1 hypothetical protein B0T40_02935 [Chromobacterium haemolyticum]PTU68443.1 cyclic nucleotide-binding protein [Chromobacterium haemolyticum]QOD81806.1 cyclic nucleotide-binding protein [Chromobacterium haemolyticum]BBH14379.1 hypothetical protein CH06BL_36270 [Chromobacterium haemolyticum]